MGRHVQRVGSGAAPDGTGHRLVRRTPRRGAGRSPALLSHYCIQARATSDDGPEAIRRASLRATHTPAVLITRGRINEQLGRIASLAPLDERRKAFRLLISVLAVADDRRRQRFCSDGCGHEWHRLPLPT
ncbi:DUF5958 family protein [Streptomyces sp. NPDC006662]|uniref:DUF5958 family protein n=1 Tax=Streptomyces sp. NPDC006662 TaxID=3156902 RepID=UPI00340CA5AE